MHQEIRFRTATDGVQIAYATVGAGPPIVRVANWLTHLELDWESSVWRHWLTGLADSHMLLRYDLRGSGLSDRGWPTCRWTPGCRIYGWWIRPGSRASR